ncbi:MAG: hypothetical protein QXS06_02635 [Desulfurococcaceae archaeon]
MNGNISVDALLAASIVVLLIIYPIYVVHLGKKVKSWALYNAFTIPLIAAITYFTIANALKELSNVIALVILSIGSMLTVLLKEKWVINIIYVESCLLIALFAVMFRNSFSQL